MADLDLGTEHLRWMGDARFMVGLLKGSTFFFAFSPHHLLNCSLLFVLFFLAPYLGGQVAQLKPCPVQLSLKIAETDKDKMAEHLVSSRKEFEKDNISRSLPFNSTINVPEKSILPPLDYLPDDVDGWTSFDEPLIYVYAGKGPYVGRYVCRSSKTSTPTPGSEILWPFRCHCQMTDS